MWLFTYTRLPFRYTHRHLLLRRSKPELSNMFVKRQFYLGVNSKGLLATFSFSSEFSPALLPVIQNGNGYKFKMFQSVIIL